MHSRPPVEAEEGPIPTLKGVCQTCQAKPVKAVFLFKKYAELFFNNSCCPAPRLLLDAGAQSNLSESQNWRHAKYVNTKEVVSLAITGL